MAMMATLVNSLVLMTAFCCLMDYVEYGDEHDNSYGDDSVG